MSASDNATQSRRMQRKARHLAHENRRLKKLLASNGIPERRRPPKGERARHYH